MVECRLRTYSFIGYIPITSNASSTYEHFHTSSRTRQSDMSDILWATLWWNPSITFNIASVTTQLLIPYINTVCTTALCFIAHAQTVSPVFVSNSATPTVAVPSSDLYTGPTSCYF